MYTYKYPRPMVTVDIILFRFINDILEILLIQRKNDPFKNKWALPGGFIEIDEPLIEAAKRELKEETSIENIELFELKSFGKPGRDPRGRTVNILYGGIINTSINYKANDDAKNAGWYGINDLPELAFDHNEVINTARKKLFEKFIINKIFIRFFKDEIKANEFMKLILQLLKFENKEITLEKIIASIPSISIKNEMIVIDDQLI